MPKPENASQMAAMSVTRQRPRAWHPVVLGWMLAGLSAASSATGIDAAILDLETAHTRMNASSESTYRELLSAFDTALLAAPGDVELAIRRCRFIAAYVDEDATQWIESAHADREACVERIGTEHSNAPAASLFVLQQTWGEEGIARIEAELEASKAWPRELRGALLAHLAMLQEFEGQDAAAAAHSLQAVEHGDDSRFEAAIDHLIQTRQMERARDMLASAQPAANAWSAARRVRLALALPELDGARAELLRYEEAQFEVDVAIAARAHLRAGDVDSATALLVAATGESAALREARYELAVARGDHAAALDEISFKDQSRWSVEAERLIAVLAASPASSVHPTAVSALVMALLMAAVLCLVPALILVPVHYRGLMRRVSGTASVPLFETVGLRVAWIALAIFLVVPMIVGLGFEPGAMLDMMFDPGKGEPAATFRAMLWGSTVALACVLILARRLGADGLVGGTRLARSLGWVVLGWLVVYAVGTLLVLLAGIQHMETDQTRLVRTLVAGGSASVGPLMTLLLFALVVPILEEIVFRGLLLGGMTRHIGFGVANFIQAILFALVHDDLPRFPSYFALGLIAGWLVRRYRSVGPAILLHMLNNVIATGASMLRQA